MALATAWLPIVALDSLDRISQVGRLVVPAPFNMVTDTASAEAREEMRQVVADMAFHHGF
jgi:hypothetical protein